ncbi:hypothetical protein KUTeg_009355 [Tegillarca granosa]|uniref:B box-type domain-containing protein n=1 Tax=Tegillarca granosa TaxID=220873 RepID=A0ABQ9F7Z3_TEGGR|nr:hypothetical protein KUTeg_009355 [Tegillarca granosa]
MLSMAGKAEKPPGLKSCDVCKKKVKICSKCTDCDDNLCYHCTVAHKSGKLSKHHKIVEYDGGVVTKTEYCLEHPSEEINLFCSQCLDVVCKTCIITIHNAHTFSDLRSVANIKREEINSRVASMKDRFIPQLQAQVTAVEQTIKENETKGENRVKQIKERGDNILDKVKEIVNDRIAESRQKENLCYNRLADTRNEINKYILYINALIDESESRMKGGSDVEILRSAKHLLSIDLEAEVEKKVKLRENFDNAQYTLEYQEVSKKDLEGYVGYLKEEESEAEKYSDVDREDTYVNLKPVLPSLMDMSEIEILTPLFTVYEQRTFSQYQHGVLIKFGVQLSSLLELKVSPALCRDQNLGDSLAQDLCDEAIQQLTDQLPPEVCSNADNLKKASLLIKYAKEFARQKFGDQHPMYAKSLGNYGWYLLKTDVMDYSIETYETSLNILTDAFGPSNMLVAKLKGELAYALYVKEYTTGNFDKAREHATEAITVLKKLVPSDSMLLCPAFRAKGKDFFCIHIH